MKNNSSLALFNILLVSVMSLPQGGLLVGLKFPFHCMCAFEMECGFVRPSLTSWFQKLTVWNWFVPWKSLLGNYLSSKTLQSSSCSSESRCKTGGVLLPQNSFCFLHVYTSCVYVTLRSHSDFFFLKIISSDQYCCFGIA